MKAGASEKVEASAKAGASDMKAEGQSMRAVVRDGYGNPGVLRLDSVPRPRPRAGEVLIAVRAAGVERGALHLLMGEPYAVRLATGLRQPRERGLGSEVAGVVEAVGSGVTSVGPGDEVMATCRAGFAEFVTAKQDRVARKPSGLSFDEAAALPISGVTALQALDIARLQPGQRVLVVGASGGVGSYAVQLAKAAGAHVVGVCRTSKMEFVRVLGADDVIDHTVAIGFGPTPYDVILDIGGNNPLRRLREALTPRGTLVIVGAEDAGRIVGMGKQLRAVMTSPFTRQRLRMLVSKENAKDLQRLGELVASGALRPPVEGRYELADVPAALDDLAAGRVCGKLVVTIG